MATELRRGHGAGGVAKSSIATKTARFRLTYWRNVRLVALKSFMRFIEYQVPSAIEQVRRVLAIPMQRTDLTRVRHIDCAEEEALLDAPDPTTRLGIRDRAILMMGTAGGLRVSEIINDPLSRPTTSNRQHGNSNANTGTPDLRQRKHAVNAAVPCSSSCVPVLHVASFPVS
ncbi:MAG: hypothetical protein MUF54_19045, partial [Polyangiaceae bacterium]|nr:hypothetical protein [Polyangiaceae bacterium]